MTLQSIDPFHQKAEPASRVAVSADSGVLTYLLPNAALPGRPYCAVFPGYTGDALTHGPFIRAALSQGLAVLCVNPKWSNSTRRMRESMTALLQHRRGLEISPEQPYFIRGASFGCDLSLAWLQGQSIGPHKIAWITPCSANQLEFAGEKMRLSVKDDADRLGFKSNAPVWIQELAYDEIVPRTDAEFMAVSPHTRATTISGADHFGAGNLPEASVGVASWFLEGYEHP